MTLARDTAIVAGGSRDPNLRVLVEAYRSAGVPVRPLLIGDDPPSIAWDLERGTLHLAGELVAPASLFVRHDVFAMLEAPSPATSFRTMAWTTALVGWLRANPEVRTLNRTMWGGLTNKPDVLLRARRLGLPTPRTLVTNDRDHAVTFLDGEPKIAKPVAGGDLARTLDHALALASAAGHTLLAPAIVQERLVAPEIRVYLVGERAFAFEVRSSHLDYREVNDATVLVLPEVPQGLEAPLKALARELELDFCAADFKADATGTLRFLEINSSPMFARFDHACGGTLSAAIVEWLAAA